MEYYCRKIIYIASVFGLLSASPMLHAEEQSTAPSTIAGTTKEYLSDPARTGSLVGSIIAGSAVANPLAPVLGSVVGFVIGKSSTFSKKSGNSVNQNALNSRSLMPADGTEVTSLSGLSGTSQVTTDPENSASTLVGIDTGTPTISLGLADDEGVGGKASNVPDLATAQPTMTNEQSGGIAIVEEIKHSHVASPLETLVPTDLVRETEMGIQPIQTTTNGLRVESAGATDLQKRLADACSNYKAVKTASLNCYYNAQ